MDGRVLYVLGNVVKILLDSVCMFGHSTVRMDVVVGEKVEQMLLCVLWVGVRSSAWSEFSVCGACVVAGMLAR